MQLRPRKDITENTDGWLKTLPPIKRKKRVKNVDQKEARLCVVKNSKKNIDFTEFCKKEGFINFYDEEKGIVKKSVSEITTMCGMKGWLEDGIIINGKKISFKKVANKKAQQEIEKKISNDQLAIFTVEEKIHGVRAVSMIPKGSVIGVYTGEVITSSERFYPYAFNLKNINKDNSLAKNDTLDAKNFGNFLCLINHAPEKPLEDFPDDAATANVEVEMTGKIVIFIANRDIDKDEQLLIDYGADYWNGAPFQPRLFSKKTGKFIAEQGINTEAKKTNDVDQANENILTAQECFQIQQSFSERNDGVEILKKMNNNRHSPIDIQDETTTLHADKKNKEAMLLFSNNDYQIKSSVTEERSKSFLTQKFDNMENLIEITDTKRPHEEDNNQPASGKKRQLSLFSGDRIKQTPVFRIIIRPTPYSVRQAPSKKADTLKLLEKRTASASEKAKKFTQADKNLLVEKAIASINAALFEKKIDPKNYLDFNFFTSIYKSNQFSKNFLHQINEITLQEKFITVIVSLSTVFSKQNISSMLNGARDLAKAINALANHADALKGLIDSKENVGFSASNIASMLSGAGAHIAVAITALANHAGALKGLIDSKENVGFSASNIASMLSGAGANILDAINALANNANHLKELMASKETPGFSASNIASMLSGAGAHIAVAITALANHADALKGLIDSKETPGFSASNIASMLSGAGANIADAISALANHANALKGLMASKETPGFSASNIASMLSGAGARIADAITALANHAGALKGLLIASEKNPGFSASNIASMLHGAGPRIEEKIKKLISRNTLANKLEPLNQNSLPGVANNTSAFFANNINNCQTALKIDPFSASKVAP